jgi:hypothetical protein
MEAESQRGSDQATKHRKVNRKIKVKIETTSRHRCHAEERKNTGKNAGGGS